MYNLSADELRKELTYRGRPVGPRKRKQELLEEFNALRQGLNDVPALLQPTPQANLEDLNLESYEILPIKPLHDIKGHLSNIIEEAIAIAKGEMLAKLQNIRKAVLSKDTLRCLHYRKAVIIMYMSLDEVDPTSPKTELFHTAVEKN